MISSRNLQTASFEQPQTVLGRQQFRGKFEHVACQDACVMGYLFAATKAGDGKFSLRLRPYGREQALLADGPRDCVAALLMTE